jgi:hypothetical protein
MFRYRMTGLAAFGAMLLLAHTSSASAQRRGFDSRTRNAGGQGYFSVGVAYMDIDDLNDRLAVQGYPTFDENFITLGGGGFVNRNGLLLGGEGHVAFQSEQTTSGGTFRTGLAGGFGMFDVGYMIVQTRHLGIYPILGVGGGGMSLSIHERSTVDFDDVLADPRRGATLTNGAFLLGGALGADWLIGTNGNGRSGFIVGVRAGYNFAPLDADWRLDGSDVAGGPDSGFTGPYVRINIGGGHRRQDLQ